MSKHGYLVLYAITSDGLMLESGMPLAMPEEWAAVMPIFKRKRDAERFVRQRMSLGGPKYEITKVRLRDVKYEQLQS